MDRKQEKETCASSAKRLRSGKIAKTEMSLPEYVPAKSKPGLVTKIATEETGISINVDKDIAEKAFGTDDNNFAEVALEQLVQLALKSSVIDQRALDFAGAALVGIAPRNTLEAMLAVQAVANHICTMKLAGQLANASTVERQIAVGNLYTKVARTFPAQLEALHRMRHGGQQKVTVEHVNVADGGQAVFGNIETGGRG